jgi:hypothetical protein
MKKSEIKYRGRIHLHFNRRGGVDGYLNNVLIISIWDDLIQFSAPVWGCPEAAMSILECQRKAIELYQKSEAPLE